MNRIPRSAHLLFPLVVLLAFCCSAAVLAAPPPKEGKPESPVARKEAPHYLVEIFDVGGRAAKEHQAELRLQGRGDYHVNVEYPTRIKLSAQGVQFKIEMVSKSDALQLTKEAGRFPLRYTPARSGLVALTAEARFSVCDDKQCDMVVETLNWSVKVE